MDGFGQKYVDDSGPSPCLRADCACQGGRGPCIGRFACCSIMTILFLIISIALSFAMVRPVYLPAGQSVANAELVLGSGFDRQTLASAAFRPLLPAVRCVVFLSNWVAMNNARK